MTKRTVVLASCNVCGDEIAHGEGATITITIEGQAHGLDLCPSDFLDAKGKLQDLLAVADQVGSKKSSSSSSGGTGSTATQLGLDPAHVREWARSNGHDVPEVGRLNQDIISAYQAAHGEPVSV